MAIIAYVISGFAAIFSVVFLFSFHELFRNRWNRKMIRTGKPARQMVSNHYEHIDIVFGIPVYNKKSRSDGKVSIK